MHAAPPQTPANSETDALRPTAVSTAATSTPVASEYAAFPRMLGRLF